MNFIKVTKTRVINLEHVTSITYHPAETFESDEVDGEIVNMPSSVEITLISTTVDEITKYDGEVIGGASASERLLLVGKEAGEFWNYVRLYSISTEGL